MKTVNPSGRSHQKSSPQHQEVLAVDALCHMGAALGVLELHAERAGSAMVCAARDLLRGYHANADLAVASLQAGDRAAGVLPQLSQDLGYAIEVIDRVNDDAPDDLVLYAVTCLLRSARSFADGRPRESA
ncbi:hypothetical protein [Delftia acidovorans]